MKYVLVNPLTKEPTAVEFPPEMAKITAGQYQNVAEVSDEWYATAVADAQRSTAHGEMSGFRATHTVTIGEVIASELMASGKSATMLRLLEQAVAAEREACAKIADEAGNGDVGWRIRCRTEGSRPPFPDSITTASVEVRWMGDSLTESPGALAILMSIPPGFTPTKELSDFYDGEQWNPKIKAEREAAGRPTLTLNMLPRLVAMAIERHIAAHGSASILPSTRETIRAYITARNRDAQMAFNYMASAALEAAQCNPDARFISPDELGKAVYSAWLKRRGNTNDRWGAISDKTFWEDLGHAAIDYYLKQPKV